MNGENKPHCGAVYAHKVDAIGKDLCNREVILQREGVIVCFLVHAALPS